MKEMLRVIALIILLALCVIPGTLALLALIIAAVALALGYSVLWAGVFIWSDSWRTSYK